MPHWTGSWLSLTVGLVLVLAKRRTPLVVVVLVDLSFGHRRAEIVFGLFRQFPGNDFVGIYFNLHSTDCGHLIVPLFSEACVTHYLSFVGSSSY